MCGEHARVAGRERWEMEEQMRTAIAISILLAATGARAQSACDATCQAEDICSDHIMKVTPRGPNNLYTIALNKLKVEFEPAFAKQCDDVMTIIEDKYDREDAARQQERLAQSKKDEADLAKTLCNGLGLTQWCAKELRAPK
jgi:hypothetical protein